MTHWRMVMGLALLVGGAVGIGLVITNSTAGGAIVSTMVLPGDARAVALDERTKHTFVVDDPSQGAGAAPGRVYVLDTRTGTVLHTVTVGRAPDFALVDERTGRVFVLNYGSGTVSVLDTDSGTVLRTTRVALGPNAAGVDEQTGRVFVSSLSPRGSMVLSRFSTPRAVGSWGASPSGPTQASLLWMSGLVTCSSSSQVSTHECLTPQVAVCCASFPQAASVVLWV
jgi:YVTN family beta-propeller protein